MSWSRLADVTFPSLNGEIITLSQFSYDAKDPSTLGRAELVHALVVNSRFPTRSSTLRCYAYRSRAAGLVVGLNPIDSQRTLPFR